MTGFLACAAMACCGVLAWLRWRDAQRLAGLGRTVRAWSDGDAIGRAPISGDDGIGELGVALNALAERLAMARERQAGSRRLLDEAVGALDEGVCCIDGRDLVAYANPAWWRFATGGEETAGHEYFVAFPSAAAGELVAQARLGRRPPAVEVDHRGRRLRLSSAPAGGSLAVLVLHDVTAMRQLESAQREFVSSVSHELKTPLTAILGFTETLLDGAIDDPQEARPMVERIQHHGDRLSSLVRDVLTLSRLETAGAPLRRERVELAAVVAEAAQAGSDAGRPRGITVSWEAEPVEVAGDREQLLQMVGNLVSNAVRYNRDGGTVSVLLERRGGSVALQVADSGPGIPDEHKPRIFDRFYRVDAHRSRQTGGTGLGLAIVRGIAASLGGTIAVADADPRPGTVFTVVLPSAP